MTKTMGSAPLTGKARILIVDDHELMRRGICSLLATNPSRWDVCGEAADGAEAITRVKTLRPNLVVLDINMPTMNGLQAAEQIRRFAPATKIILLTMHSPAQFDSVLRQGSIDAVVSKATVSGVLMTEMERVLADNATATDNVDHHPEGEIVVGE